MSVKYTLFFWMVLSPLLAKAQLYGVVTGEQKEPLAYASVYVRGTTQGTTTNSDGAYRLPLEPGTYDIVYQYLGYQRKIQTVTIGDKPKKLDVNLLEADLQLGEVVITTEDPAYRIMREAIAKRSYYQTRINQYTCDAYVKGLYKLLKSPKKIMGQEVGNMGGILDSLGSGVLYLSESVSRLYVQKKPSKMKEEMISSKVSGSTNGFSLNRANLMEINLYEETTDIDRDILSPLAGNAFSYYDFRLKGEFTDDEGNLVYKIALNPKRKDDPVWDGFIYIIDSWWNLYGADVFLRGTNIKQPVLDTLRFRQEFTRVEKPDKWALLSQATEFRFSIFGFDVGGSFNSVLSNYNLNPDFSGGFFTRETFRVEDTANKRDTGYWAAIRPIPLTEEEVVDYNKKDSLEQIWESKAFRDSMDRKANKFTFTSLTSGYSWRNSWKQEEFSIGSPLSVVHFNTVQGWLMGSPIRYTKKSDRRNTRYTTIEGAAYYSFGDQRLRYEAGVKRKFDSIRYRTAFANGGIRAAQFNPQNPITQTANGLYSLYSRRNYMKLYDQSFGEIGYSQMLAPWLKGGLQAQYSARRLLENRSDEVFERLLIQPLPAYSPNMTLISDQDGFVNPYEFASDALVLQFDARIRIGATYSSYPSYRIYSEGKYPEIRLRYRKAIPGVGRSAINFDQLQVEMGQTRLGMGLFGKLSWQVIAGVFPNSNRMGIMDMYIPMGNQTFFGSGGENRLRRFDLMPYYEMATDRSYVEGHLEHHLQGWVFDKIPGIRKLQFKEVLGARFYYSPQTVGQTLLGRSHMPYWELNAGIENIGIGPIRPLRLDFAFGFEGGRYTRNGVLLGISL
jgi:hypothetical protein